MHKLKAIYRSQSRIFDRTIQCGYFFFGNLKKVFKVILWNKILG
jgi:hypothetical protein